MKGLLKFIAVAIILGVVLYLCSDIILLRIKDLVLSQADKDRSSRMLYVLGEVAENLKKYEVAAGIYKDLVGMKPMATLASEGQFRLARCYEKMGRRKDAVREYRVFIKDFPYDRLVPEATRKARGMLDEPAASRTERSALQTNGGQE